MKKTFGIFLFVAFNLTVLAGISYVAAQQTLRLSANDPQIQLAEDIGTAVASGQQFQLSAGDQVDIGKSLSNFVYIYDDSDNILTSDAVLNGSMPVPPKSVIDNAKQHGQQRITWEPAKGYRYAIVIQPVPGHGAVMVGRSLREVEKRENSVMIIVGAMWLFAILVDALIMFVTLPLLRRAKSAGHAHHASHYHE